MQNLTKHALVLSSGLLLPLAESANSGTGGCLQHTVYEENYKDVYIQPIKME